MTWLINGVDYVSAWRGTSAEAPTSCLAATLRGDQASFREFRYRIDSWSRSRRVVAKAAVAPAAAIRASW